MTIDSQPAANNQGLFAEQAERFANSSRLSVRAGRFLHRVFRKRSSVFGAIVILIVILSAILAPVIAPFPPTQIKPAEALRAPSSTNLLGTDEIGRDILSRIIYGARVSIMVGVISIGIAMLLGIPLGLFSGFFGGWSDSVIMRLMDVLLAFPAIVLASSSWPCSGPPPSTP